MVFHYITMMLYCFFIVVRISICFYGKYGLLPYTVDYKKIKMCVIVCCIF